MHRHYLIAAELDAVFAEQKKTVTGFNLDIKIRTMKYFRILSLRTAHLLHLEMGQLKEEKVRLPFYVHIVMCADFNLTIL